MNIGGRFIERWLRGWRSNLYRVEQTTFNIQINGENMSLTLISPSINTRHNLSRLSHNYIFG